MLHQRILSRRERQSARRTASHQDEIGQLPGSNPSQLFLQAQRTGAAPLRVAMSSTSRPCGQRA
jgi:hypothetical protein